MKTLLVILALCPLMMWGQVKVDESMINEIKSMMQGDANADKTVPSLLMGRQVIHIYKNKAIYLFSYITFRNSDTLSAKEAVKDPAKYIKKIYYSPIIHENISDYRKGSREETRDVIPEEFQYKSRPPTLNYRDSTEAATEAMCDKYFFGSIKEAMNSVAKFMELENRKPAPRKKPSALR